jgi:hypothetical protein
MPQEGIGVVVTHEITNWERACRDYDGICLTADGADAVAWEMTHGGIDTAFHAWNAESTLWARWVFERVDAIDDRSATIHPVTD